MVSGSVLIKRAQPADSRSIAGLHHRQIPSGLLSQLGEEFVATFYTALIRSPLGFGFVAEQDGRLVGFASGVVDWRRFYREFLRRHLRPVVRALAASLSQGRWRRLLETSRYAASADLPQAELVSIALEPDARATGIGGELVHRMLEEFAARRVHEVRVTAGDANLRANRLYEKMGFRLHSRLEIHRGETAMVYVIVLNSSGPRERKAT